MTTPTLKERVRACDRLCGTHITLADPVITEILGQCGYDYLWMDTGHSPMDYQNLYAHLSAVRMAGVPAVVRVAA